MSNHRPISILLCMCKIFENIIVKQMSVYFERIFFQIQCLDLEKSITVKIYFLIKKVIVLWNFKNVSINEQVLNVIVLCVFSILFDGL